MNGITQILFDRIKDNKKLIKRNTELIEKLLDRIIELENNIKNPPTITAEGR